MLAAVRDAGKSNAAAGARKAARVGEGVSILLIDHEDSFVHTLANYFRQTGAKVTTVRTPVADNVFDEMKPDLVVLSPGPGSPSDFNCKATIQQARSRDLPVFGVCLGLQALAEAYGGQLRQLAIPMHGKPSLIRAQPTPLFAGLPEEFHVGRYHSLFLKPDQPPQGFRTMAESDDGVAMAAVHDTKPWWGVQFHPESIMTLDDDHGLTIIENVVENLAAGRNSTAAA